MASGAPIVVRDAEMLFTLADSDLKERILFLDYALIDNAVNGDGLSNGSQLNLLIDQGLAGVVLVTQYSNRAGESRG